MARTTQSQSQTESPTRKAAKLSADDSVKKDKDRIEAIKEAGKASRAPDSLIRHFIGSNTTTDDAQKGFKELAEKGTPKT
jgi:3-phenylpropionate/cinnamic acid dioxygenase small subunit